MAQEKLVETLKKDIRSLLISAKDGLAPEQLKRDYMKMLGRPLPFMSLGYRTVLDMVQDMPDVVEVNFSRDGTLELKAIGDETTRGIEQLVSRQRSTNQQPSGKKEFHYQCQRDANRAAPVLHRRYRVPPAAPAGLRSLLRQLLSQGPVALSELEHHFALRFGRPLQAVHYGFYSIAEMLASVSDLVDIKQGRTGSVISLKSTAAPLRHVGTALSSTTQQRGASLASESKKSSVSAVEIKHDVKSDCTEEPIAPKKASVGGTRGDGNPHAGSSLPAPELSQQESSFENCVERLEEELKNWILECGVEGTVTSDLKEKLRKVLAVNSEGVSVHDFPGEYKKLFGEELPVAQNGFVSVTEMVGALSDTFYLKPDSEKEGNHWIVMDTLCKNAEQEREHEKGLNAKEPPEALNLSSICYCLSSKESAWEGESNSKLSSQDTQLDTDLRVASEPPHQVFRGVTLPAVPLDALHRVKLCVTACRQERALMAVVVERVVSPDHFYIRFHGTPEARALENMMIEMRSCYVCPEISERYRLPESCVQLGQVCCLAPYDVWFYRVVIHKILNENQVEVYYVDFGDVGTTDWRCLKLLKSCYSELPAQAVLSSLARVQPVGGSWSSSAVSYFQKLCCVCPLVAAVDSYQDDVLYVFLCDTNTEEDVYFHSVLQSQGHARAADSRRIPLEFNPVSLYLMTAQHEDNAEETETEEDDLSDLPELEYIRDRDVPDVTQVNFQGQAVLSRLHLPSATLPPTPLTAGVLTQASGYGGGVHDMASQEKMPRFTFSMFTAGNGVGCLHYTCLPYLGLRLVWPLGRLSWAGTITGLHEHCFL